MELLQKIKEFVVNKAFLKSLLYIVLIYTVVVTALNFYLDSYTNHGEKIAVPDLKGKNIKAIAAMMEDLSLSYEVLDSIYDPSLAPGTIIDQDPRPTAMSEVFVKEGRTIRLRISKRTRYVEVPMLIDKSQRFAESVLKNRGLLFSLGYRNTTEAHGAVLQQTFRGKNLRAGQRIPVGSTIHLIIGRNEGGMPLPIPNLYGLTIFEAQERLLVMPTVSLFSVCNECVTTQDSLAARINSQTPEYFDGGMMPPGSTITVNAVLNFVDTTRVE